MNDFIYFSQNKNKNNFEPLDYIPTEKEFIKNEPLRTLIISILISDSFAFMNEQTLISADYFKSKLSKVQDYVKSSYPSYTPAQRALKVDAIEFLVCQMIGLRLVKEIRAQNIPFPFEKISQLDAASDLKDLQKLLTQIRSGNAKLRPVKFDSSFPQDMAGAMLSRSYTHLQRYAVSTGRRGDANHSPISVWSQDNMTSMFCGILRQKAMKARRATETLDSYQFDRFSMELTPAKIRFELMRKYGVNQSHPLYVGVLIHFLTKTYNADIKRYLDLCMGWGDRLVGAFGAAVLGLERYVGTDPNTSLESAYKGLVDEHQPQGFQSFIYNKPMENCTSAELCPNNQTNELMYTSPPYFNLEKYPGNNQSHVLYNNYETWRENFLYTLIKQACNGLSVGGFIAIEMGNAVNKSFNISNDIRSYVSKCIFLQGLGEFLNTRGKISTPTILFRFTGDNHLEAPFCLPTTEATSFTQSSDEFAAASALLDMSSPIFQDHLTDDTQEPLSKRSVDSGGNEENANVKKLKPAAMRSEHKISTAMMLVKKGFLSIKQTSYLPPAEPTDTPGDIFTFPA
ncbi:hypothetical protein [Legionella birminghamensis]|nr:hypothetical protein [Legionella birminghamensis]